MKSKKIIIIAFVFMSLAIYIKAGQPVSPTSMFSYFGPRALAMMGAQTAIADDVFGIVANPVGVENLKEPEFGSAYLNWFGNTSFIYNGIVLPQKKDAYMSLGVMYFSVSPFDEILTDAELSAQKIGLSDASVYVGYSVPIHGLFLLNSLLRIGGNAKLIYSKIVDSYANTVVFDLGARYTIMTLNHSFMIAFALQNWGMAESFGDYQSALEKKYKFGIGSELQFGKNLIVPDIDTIYSTSSGFSVTSGLEYSYLFKKQKIASLRLGYELYNQSESANFLSFGIGSEFKLQHFFVISSIALDYSLSMLHDLGYTHSASIKMKFSSFADFAEEEKLKTEIRKKRAEKKKIEKAKKKKMKKAKREKIEKAKREKIEKAKREKIEKAKREKIEKAKREKIEKAKKKKNKIAVKKTKQEAPKLIEQTINSNSNIIVPSISTNTNK